MNISRKITRILTLIHIFLLLGAYACHAFDWKSCHEESEKITEQQARENNAGEPDSIEKLYVLGLVCINNYKLDEAEGIFNQILSRSPETFEARWGLAEVYRGRHQYDKAKSILKELIKMHPEFAPAYTTLAFIEYRQMNFKESVRFNGVVINMDPDLLDLNTLVTAHGIYAAAKGMMAQFGGPLSRSFHFFAVRRHLRIAQDLDPDSIVVLFGYGSFYMSIPTVLGRDLKKAEEYLRRAIEVDPLFAEPYVRLAQLYKLKGDEESFNKYMDKAFELDPTNDVVLDVKKGTCKFICLDKDE